MSNKAQLQIQFPAPGQWDKFTLTAVYRDAEGYTHTATCTQNGIDDEHLPALASVVSALVGLAAPWQASQVWARLDESISMLPANDDTPAGFVAADVVELTVEAVNEQGGRRVFTPDDYPEFVIFDSAAVAFFKHFTTNQ